MTREQHMDPIPLRELLTFEREHPIQDAAKSALIREKFGRSPVRYYAQLGTIVHHPMAALIAPDVIARIQKIRAKRDQERAARRRPTQ